MTRARALAPALAAALAAAGGCAASVYERAGSADDLGAALARRGAAENRPVNATGRPLAFLCFGGVGHEQLGAFDLAQSKLLWTQPAEVSARIAVGRDALLHARRGEAGRPELIARDIGTGAILWRHDVAAGESLLGYAADGDTAYYTVTTGHLRRYDAHETSATPAEIVAAARVGRATLVALDARSGAERWRRDLPSPDAGAPAARGGLVAVPTQSQYVLVLDGGSGRQLAQILSREQTASYVGLLPEGLLFGDGWTGIYLASPETAAATRRSPGYLELNLRLPKRPYHRDMYRPEHGDYSALDRDRVLWRVTAGGGGRASFRGGMVFVHDYRFFFGLDAASGDVRWAHDLTDTDAVSSIDTGDALLFATADGELGALDAATGRRVYTARAPGVTLVRGATFDADGFAGAGAAAPARGGDATLAAVLTRILWDGDQRFGDLKVFVLGELGKQPDRDVTATLLKALQAPDLSAALHAQAAQALIAHPDPAAGDLLAAALEAHADYAAGRGAPRVDVLAHAAGATGARAAALALARHLQLPETEPSMASDICRALAVMNATEALPQLRDFLSIYRADPVYSGDPRALVAAADALLRLGGPAERQLLLFLSQEPRTVAPLREHIQRALADTAAPHAPDLAKTTP
jgi:outer membrane protein assembly factor BamB